MPQAPSLTDPFPMKTVSNGIGLLTIGVGFLACFVAEALHPQAGS